MFLILSTIDRIENSDERELILYLFNTYAKKVKALAMLILRNEEDAEDAVGNVFIKIIKYRQKFIDIDRDETVRKIVIYCRSVCFDMLDKRNKLHMISLITEVTDTEGIVSELEPADDIDLENIIVGFEESERLKAAINRLTSPAREIILLKYYEQMRNNEIADLLGINASTVGTILQRSLLKLKKEMEGYVDDGK